MCSLDDDPLKGLDDDLDRLSKENAKPAVKHPCGQCGGTGLWRRGINRYGQKKCFACNGKGFFKTSQAHRDKARESRRVSKAKKLATAQQAFEEQFPGLMSDLIAVADWNQFARSMVDSYQQYGALTEKQVKASQRMLAKLAENKAKREAERKENETVVDLSPIKAMFATAVNNGLKRPKYRAEGLVITMAPSHGANAGHLYVKTLALKIAEDDYSSGDYQGKITPDNVFKPAYGSHKETVKALHVIAANPLQASMDFGRKTGTCGCCGRELTDPNSIAAGIGPICANKWGF